MAILKLRLPQHVAKFYADVAKVARVKRDTVLKIVMAAYVVRDRMRGKKGRRRGR
jgi:hypothetical protein